MFESAIHSVLTEWIRSNRYRLESIIEKVVDSVMTNEHCESIVTDFLERKTQEILEDYTDFDDFLEEEISSYD